MIPVNELDIEYNYRAFCCWIEAAIDYIEEADYYIMDLDEFYELYPNIFRKKIKVIFHNGTDYIGELNEIFEEDSEIMVGNMCIDICDIKDIELVEEKSE